MFIVNQRINAVFWQTVNLPVEVKVTRNQSSFLNTKEPFHIKMNKKLFIFVAKFTRLCLTEPQLRAPRFSYLNENNVKLYFLVAFLQHLKLYEIYNIFQSSKQLICWCIFKLNFKPISTKMYMCIVCKRLFTAMDESFECPLGAVSSQGLWQNKWAGCSLIQDQNRLRLKSIGRGDHDLHIINIR